MRKEEPSPLPPEEWARRTPDAGGVMPMSCVVRFLPGVSLFPLFCFLLRSLDLQMAALNLSSSAAGCGVAGSAGGWAQWLGFSCSCGSDPEKPLLMAIKGQIYDVSQSSWTYFDGKSWE